MEILDFSKRKNFPGESGNDFDVVLRRYESVEHINGFVFALLLFGLACLPTGFKWGYAAGLWLFFLLDWLLIARLPKAGKSFGPAKPPTLLLACMRLLLAWLPLPAALILQIMGTLLVIYGFWIEPLTLKVTRQVLRSEKIKPGTQLSVLHLGDLHIERMTQREELLNEQVKRLSPDLILFSGDVLNLSYNREEKAIQEARKVMAEWQAPLGAYAVAGSPAVDMPDILPQIYDGLPIRLLDGERVTIAVGEDKIDLIGLACSHRPFQDAPIVKHLTSSSQGNFTILLYHSPDLAPNAQTMGIDLQLSGHTHGGQVQLPLWGALFTASLYGRVFSNGRYLLDKMVLYITRGLGMEGAGAPRVRFLCPPEIILWEIKSNQD